MEVHVDRIDDQHDNSYWSLYFGSKEQFSVDDRRVLLINELLSYLQSSDGEWLLDQVVEREFIHVLSIDYQRLQELCPVVELFSAFQTIPEEALTCLGAAAYEALCVKSIPHFRPSKVITHLRNHPESSIALRDLKASCVGRLVTVYGTVVRVSAVKPMVTDMNFSCSKCGDTQFLSFIDGKYAPPIMCTSGGCRSKSFNPVKLGAEAVDFQKVRLQEIITDEFGHEGRIPRTVDCELTEDLVDSCLPGDIITVCGIVKILSNDDTGTGRGKNKNLFYLYIDAKSVTTLKVESTEGRDVRVASPSNMSSSSSENVDFVRYATEHGSNLLKHVVYSLCPSIYGHELVKAGIVLLLFGGVQKHINDENRVPVRGDIHALIVGDPGLGKSQLLKSAAAVSPRGLYVCGNTTTNVGLTVAVVKDSVSGDYTFEAGAMVLADQGVCAIDEFDKMVADHQALLEAMEQQCVSVAKAGLLANLSARTSVLAAANPVGGHYNRSKTVNENLKMSAALLSRFDLIFILLDRPDADLDQRLSEHILALHAGGGENTNKQSFLSLGSLNLQKAGDENVPLAQRLRVNPQQDAGYKGLPPALLRKYIAYARQHISPRLSEEASDVLKKFYLQLREHSNSRDGTPITARQLESLVRLAEARARLELRENISRQDALDVVEIMNESLYDKLVDEHGHIDFNRTNGMSKSKDAKQFLASLKRFAHQRQEFCFTRRELVDFAEKIGLLLTDLDDIIERLNEQGFLLKKGKNTYQVL